MPLIIDTFFVHFSSSYHMKKSNENSNYLANMFVMVFPMFEFVVLIASLINCSFLICLFLFVYFSLSQWELNSLVYVQCMWMRIVCVAYECFVFDSVSFCDSWRSVIINWFMWIQFEFWADSGFNCCAVCGKSLNHICLYGECNLRYCITKEGPPPTTGME